MSHKVPKCHTRLSGGLLKIKFLIQIFPFTHPTAHINPYSLLHRTRLRLVKRFRLFLWVSNAFKFIKNIFHIDTVITYELSGFYMVVCHKECSALTFTSLLVKRLSQVFPSLSVSSYVLYRLLCALIITSSI